MPNRLYLEDLNVGDVFPSAGRRVGSEEIKRFAGDFDPQPFHLNEADAQGTFFGGLAASGWHTAALTMRLLVESLPLAGGIIGVGMDELRWPAPVRPDDVLHVESVVLEVRPSKSRPDGGLAKFRTTTLNQQNEPVQILVSNLVVQRRV